MANLADELPAPGLTARPSRTLPGYLGLVLRGMCMGAADIVPGVSGGTMAFILGIYEELIQSIKGVVSPAFLRPLLARRFAEAFQRLNWPFLVSVAAGILIAALSLARLLESLLENRPVIVWSFFFGLVMASVFVVYRRVARWTPGLVLATLSGAAGAYFLVGLVPLNTPSSAWFLFLCGALAICAMVLPGISGAFILVLLGKYQFVLAAFNDLDLVPLFFVAAGAAVGIVSFAQLLGWLFSRYHDPTVAVLIGLMAGSLRKIWPWKRDVAWLLDDVGQLILNSDGHRIATVQENYLPALSQGGGAEIGLALALCLAGILTVLLLDRVANRRDPAAVRQAAST